MLYDLLHVPIRCLVLDMDPEEVVDPRNLLQRPEPSPNIVVGCLVNSFESAGLLALQYSMFTMTNLKRNPCADSSLVSAVQGVVGLCIHLGEWKSRYSRRIDIKIA